MVQKWGLWEQELKEVERMLTDDVRNNSAWNQRYFVYKNSPQLLDIERELKWIRGCLLLAPHNESPWNYLKGLVQLSGKSLTQLGLEELALKWAKDNIVSFALSLLLDIYQETHRKQEYLDTCDVLIQQDTIRQFYWQYKKANFSNESE